MFQAIQSIDSAVLLWIQEYLRSDLLDSLMVSFTKLGNHGLLFIVMTLLALFYVKTRKAGMASAIALLLGLVIVSFVLKPLIFRPRPYEVVDGLRSLIIEAKDPYSFPSGHTCAAFELAGTWSKLIKKKWVSVCTYFLAFLMGFSRLYVAVHNPSDVIAGALIGIINAMIAIGIIRMWENRKKPVMERGK